MRISDWSSDVCSSDLFDGAAMIARVRPAATGDLPHDVICPALHPACTRRDGLGGRNVFRLDGAAPGGGGGAAGTGTVDLMGRCVPTFFRLGLGGGAGIAAKRRSEEHTSELQSLMRSSYAVLCLKE